MIQLGGVPPCQSSSRLTKTLHQISSLQASHLNHKNILVSVYFGGLQSLAKFVIKCNTCGSDFMYSYAGPTTQRIVRKDPTELTRSRSVYRASLWKPRDSRIQGVAYRLLKIQTDDTRRCTNKLHKNFHDHKTTIRKQTIRVHSTSSTRSKAILSHSRIKIPKWREGTS